MGNKEFGFVKEKSHLRSLEMTKKTIVKGIRAKPSFWEKCDNVAKSENIDRNKLIIRVVNEYIKKQGDCNDK